MSDPFDDIFPTDNDDLPDDQPDADSAGDLPDEDDTLILPPRVVAETPLGGVPPRPVLGEPDEDTLVESVDSPVADPMTEPEADMPPVEPFDPDTSTIPGTVQAADLRRQIKDAATGADSDRLPTLPPVTPLVPDGPTAQSDDTRLKQMLTSDEMFAGAEDAADEAFAVPEDVSGIPAAPDEPPFDLPAFDVTPPAVVAENAARPADFTIGADSDAEPEIEPEPAGSVWPAAAVEPEPEPVLAPEPEPIESPPSDIDIDIDIQRDIQAGAVVKSTGDVTPAADMAGPGDWDDDVSPELAAILFSPPAATAVPTPDTRPVDTGIGEAEPVPAAARTIPAPVAPEPPAEPVQLTDIADSRRLHLYADGRSAPAPGKALEARHRYTRIEEPLDEDEDKGDRVREEWRYFKSGLPGLGGRLVTEIRVEEVTHTDGSWEFRFERRYQDHGRDRREVRANRDHTYIERKDEVSKIDAETGKRQRYREEAALIFAPPEQEEKRGFLSALLGRDHDDTPAGPSVWRAPSSSERKQARKDGGAAF